MDPFRLACPHCSSKIIVRHEPLLGQTLPCPKCKGPIAVPSVAPSPNAQNSSAPGVSKATTPKSTSASNPQASLRPGFPIVDSTAMTKVGDVDWNDLLANEETSSRSESDGESGLKFRTDNEPNFIPIPSTYSATPASTSTATASITKRIQQNNQLAKRRQWLTLATILVGGSLFAIVGFLAFTRAVGTKTKQSSEAIASTDPKPKETPKPEIVETKELAPVNDLLQNDATPNPEVKSPDSSNAEKETQGVTPPNNNTTPTSAQPEVSPAPTAAEVPATPQLESNDEANLPAAFATGSLPPWLLGNTSDIPTISAQENELSELNIEDAEVNRDQQFHREPAAIPSWEQKSKSSFNSFRAKDISLLRCIDMFGRYTGVGITVDWESCRIADIDLRKKVDINAPNQTIAEITAQLLKENGLIWSLDPSGLPVVSAPKTAIDAKVQFDWSIAGLFPPGSESQGCDSLLRLWGYDDGCKLVGDKLEWSEQATAIERANLAASLFLLAKLRNQSWNQPSESNLVFSPNLWNKSAPGFERRIKSNVLVMEKRPITDLLMTAANETQLNLVVDWKNVWTHGLTPSDTAATVLGGRNFPQVAKRFLIEYALEMMPISEDTVLLTTRDARRKQYRVVPLRLPKNFKIEDLKQSLRALAPVVDEQSKFRIIPVPGTDDLFFARICTPRVDQLNDPDIMAGLGWLDR